MMKGEMNFQNTYDVTNTLILIRSLTCIYALICKEQRTQRKNRHAHDDILDASPSTHPHSIKTLSLGWRAASCNQSSSSKDIRCVIKNIGQRGGKRWCRLILSAAVLMAAEFCGVRWASPRVSCCSLFCNAYAAHRLCL